jgi:hypothetical protein
MSIITTSLVGLGSDWVRHAPLASRVVQLTDAGRGGLAAAFGLSLDDACPAAS